MISLIFAIDKNNLIGKGNDLPWYYPEDLKYFKETTMNKTVVMGENTFYSITFPQFIITWCSSYTKDLGKFICHVGSIHHKVFIPFLQ